MQASLETVQQRLQYAMQARGVTATNLAYALGVSKSSVSDWLKGGGLTLNNITAIAVELNLSLDWLLHGKGSMDLFGPIHPSKDEMQLIQQLRNAGPTVFEAFFNMLGNMAKPMLGDDPVSQILALEMLEKSRMPMTVINHKGFIIDINEICMALLGDQLDKQKDVVGSHFANWIHEDDIKLAYQHMHDGMRNGHSTNFSCQLRRRTAKHATNESLLQIIVSAIYHGTEHCGHFQCVIFPLD